MRIPFISLRTKLILALAISSLVAVLLVGLIAKWLVLQRFNDLALQRAFSNFSQDVTQYIAKYGSWQEADAREHFTDFVKSRRPPPPDLPKPRPGQDLRPPFRFVLIDPQGVVIHGPPTYPRDHPVDKERRAREMPIRIEQKLVAYALPLGQPNLSELDLSYLDAMDRALWLAAFGAGGFVLLLGILFGNQLSNSLRRLNAALSNMRPGELRQQVAIDTHDEVGALAGVFNRMSTELATAYDELKSSHRQVSEQATLLRELSIRDELTGLYNRRHFNEQAQQLLQQSKRYGRPLSVMIGDIDYFKKINDQFGHTTGDEVLRAVAKLIGDEVRDADVVARYGGEEFVVLFPETPHGVARSICERLREVVESYAWDDIADGLSVTISMGVCADTKLPNYEAMLSQADENLYRAKEGGRNRVVGQE